MTDSLDHLKSTRVLAVLRASSVESALLAAEAVIAGGVTGLEITFTTPHAPTVIRELAARHGERIYLGAGTVMTPREAELAATAGARFLVSPGSRRSLVAAMKATGLTVMTGAMTPTEIMIALEYGTDVIKIFPASLGGPAFLRSLRGPFPHAPLMPTGGVTTSNVAEWFNAGAIAVGIGGELVSAADLAASRYDEIERKARLFAAAGELA